MANSNCSECLKIKITNLEPVKNPLVIIGNGPSFQISDLNLLKNVDTYGLKSAYKMYPKLNFWPKYWSCFDSDWLHSKDHFQNIIQLIKNSPIQRFIFFEDDKIIDHYNVFKIKVYVPEITKHQVIDNWKETEINATKYISSINNVDEPTANGILYQLLNRYNVGNDITLNGIKKLLNNENLNDNDFTKNEIIFKIDSTPKDFSKFYYNGGPSSLIACHIGICMGYKKIILLGIDCNYGSNMLNNYWDKNIYDGFLESPNYIQNLQNHFNTTDLNEIMKKINEYHINEFTKLREDIKHLNIDIVNCSEQSNFNVFRKGNLKDELNCRN